MIYDDVSREFGGTAGVLRDEILPVLNVSKGSDAYIISWNNEME